jgi:hypothetical protein
MSKLVWDQTSEHFYETGVDHGVLYRLDANGDYKNAYAWNGLTGVTESPSGADETKLWADNIKYLSLRAAEEFGGTITAYTYPDEFAECDGSILVAPGVFAGQQNRKTFGLSYRTIIGNDTDLNEHGYKLHLVYGCTCSPSEKAYSTVNDSPEALEFSWEFSTTPVAVTMTGVKPTSILTIDSTKVDAGKLEALEDKLYGTENASAYLPLPDEVISTLSPASV